GARDPPGAPVRPGSAGRLVDQSGGERRRRAAPASPGAVIALGQFDRQAHGREELQDQLAAALDDGPVLLKVAASFADAPPGQQFEAPSARRPGLVEVMARDRELRLFGPRPLRALGQVKYDSI